MSSPPLVPPPVPPPLGPPPVPPLEGGGVASNVAVTFLVAPMLMVHVADVPLQSPDHPARLALVPAIAVNTTVESAGRDAEQAVLPWPQSMPPVDEVTLPVPLLFTWSR